jgi:hypothetical protein
VRFQFLCERHDVELEPEDGEAPMFVPVQNFHAQWEVDLSYMLCPVGEVVCGNRWRTVIIQKNGKELVRI